MLRIFPSIALAAFAFGILHGQSFAAGARVSPDGGPLLLQLMSGSRLTFTAPQPAFPAPSLFQAPAGAAGGGGIDRAFLPRIVAYDGAHPKGTIIIDTEARYLYLTLGDGKAMRYGVGVGRPGFEWAGTHTITRKAEWPEWVPPDEMRERVPNLPVRMAGGPENPLGARALYLGSTLYRIHGSNEPWTIGHAVSSGCIRMRNEDVIDLYGRVGVGTRVIVL
jgi:lipoprotein-anchoring transpeptidase ErfK/SrfK